MSILNRPNDGLFNVLIVIYGTLHISKKSLSRDELEGKCSPGIIEESQIRNTINRWTQLGLFVEQDNKYSIADEYKSNLEWDKTKKNLPKILRKILFSEANNREETFWGSENNLSADFTRGLSWLLAQDVYTFDTKNPKTVQQLENHQIPTNYTVIQNDTRWAGLRSWATYLGFGWESDTFVIDPTIAIRVSLDEIFKETNDMPISSFLQTLSILLPVLDGGRYRNMVEDQLNQQVWRRPNDNWLSTSLSRALKRLEISRYIKMEQRADTQEVRFLTGQGGKQWENPVSHLRRMG